MFPGTHLRHPYSWVPPNLVNRTDERYNTVYGLRLITLIWQNYTAYLLQYNFINFFFPVEKFIWQQQEQTETANT